MSTDLKNLYYITETIKCYRFVSLINKDSFTNVVILRIQIHGHTFKYIQICVAPDRNKRASSLY